MARGVKLITETREEEVVLLKDVDAEFISLVRHGANQSPFRVVKSEDKGGGVMSRVIQSILLPKGVKLEELATKEGLGWLSEVRTDEIEEFDEYNRIVQMKEEKFDRDSLNLIKIDESGSWAVVGKLADAANAKDILTLGKLTDEKAISIETPAMDQPIAEHGGPTYVITFRDMFERELGSFLNVVRGSLNQTKFDKNLRKKTVMNALDAFKSFLAIGLDALAEAEGKGKKEDTRNLGEGAVDRILAAVQEIKEGGKTMTEKFEFKDKDEFVALVTETVTNVLKGMGIEKKEAEVTTQQKVEKGAESEDKTLVAKFDAFEKKFDKRLESLEEQLTTDPTVQDDESPKDKEKESVFAGMFTKSFQEGGLNRFLSGIK